ncbi:MAG: type II toxin-antitoxin system HipA family toxin [Betaproteobacteria bacterium]|nr:type II toxin-antitoxin system HipA family toxin [Betaproteobacteria bacterium]MDE2211250.1 type II toxin-antitoxin system HipA family toxin [Betaproteobacteria bacterium]
MAEIMTLDVFLGDTLVGKISRLPGSGDLNIFVFDDGYLANPQRPTLSLGFKGRTGNIAYEPRPYNTRVHPFFANLLPEGHLRDYITQRDGVSRERDFFLLQALGEDLPGAVIIRPSDGPGQAIGDFGQAVTPPGALLSENQPLKFSLAGVQIKFSAIREASGGLTIPAFGRGGSWIVKLPSERFEAVPENEYAMMRLAAAVGLNVPEIDLVPVASVQGLPSGMREDDKAFVIRRFDREGGQRIHIEDFGQVFHLFPGEKYTRASYGNIARVIWTELGEPGLREFIARLVFNVAIGNGDMHVKNWSLIYPDGRKPELAPAYDFLSTLTYVGGRETMALGLGGTKDFRDVSESLLTHFASKVGLPAEIILESAQATAKRTVEVWADLRGQLDFPEKMKMAIDEHMRQVPLIKDARMNNHH